MEDMNRQGQIIQILLEAKAYITIGDVANQLSVSPRTIRYDLESVEEISKKTGTVLIKKPGVGIFLQGTDENKQHLMRVAQNLDKEVILYSPENRRRIILEVVLASKQGITIEGLSKLLFVSKAAIHKDVEGVEKWLESYSLELCRKQNHELFIIGREASIRKAIAALVLMNPKKESQKTEEISNDMRVDNEAMNQLKGLIPLDYKQLEILLIKVERLLSFRFLDEAFMSLMIHIAIAIKRTNEGSEIHLSEELYQQLILKPEYEIAFLLCQWIQEYFHVPLPKDEVGYILLHILGSKYQNFNIENIGINLEGLEDLELPTIMAKEIAVIAAKATELELTRDQAFINGLMLHLRPTIHRLKYDLTLKNPILEAIKNDYPDFFGVAWMTSAVFEHYLGKKLKEDEVAYLALHIGAAVERNKKLIRVILVCHSGIGTSQFLSARLNNGFRELQVVKVMSTNEVNEVLMDDIDFVITTVPFIAHIPTILVNPLLGPKDITRIKDMIVKCKEKEKRKNKMPFIDDDLIFIEDFRSQVENNGLKIKKAAISKMCQELFKKGLVSKEFEKDVLERETFSSTFLGNNLCIPHGKPSLVYRTGFAVTYFKQPIICEEEEISMILLVSISEEQSFLATAIFRNLYIMLERSDFLETIKTITNKSQIIKMLGEI
jgi:transcriptional antiterminator